MCYFSILLCRPELTINVFNLTFIIIIIIIAIIIICITMYYFVF